MSLTPRLPEQSKLTPGRSNSSRLQKLFNAIDENDVSGAKAILEHSDVDLDSPDAGTPDEHVTMCHPLCACSKCSDVTRDVTNGGDSRTRLASVSLEQVSVFRMAAPANPIAEYF